MPKDSSCSSVADESLTYVPHSIVIKKAGYLQKWTNYIKGYRQRWFVLDSNGILSYYRGCEDVGHACRGSLNLRESQIHTDPATCNLSISASSQVFHLKANDEVDRQQWLQALEYSRHCAIKKADSDEDDEATNTSLSNIRDVLDSLHVNLDMAVSDVRNADGQIKKLLNETVKTTGTKVDDKITTIRKLTDELVNTVNNVATLTKKDVKILARYVANEHDQRLQLQEQIETLAKQHSKLERVAFNNSTADQLPFTESDDEFHDAVDDFQADADERNSNSSLQSSIDRNDREMFSAEIVTPRDDTSSGVDTSSVNTSSSIVKAISKKRRETIPERLEASISLWSIMRNCIGKDLTKIPMPVHFNEPLSVLQRITEDLEYAYLLDRGAHKSSLEQLCFVAAYAISCYSTTGSRTTKPFNPLLGETYECDRSDDLGWKSVAEQVSHHPPASAHHAEGKDWIMYQDFSLVSRFRGKYLSVTPTGVTHVKYKNQKNIYTFRKITTTVHNIIVGKLWIDNHGDMVIENHGTGERCVLVFNAYNYFSSEKPRKVTGFVKDSSGNTRYAIQGYWDKYVDVMEVTKCDMSLSSKGIVETNAAKRLWTINPPYPNNEKMYHFTKLAIQLNEMEEGIAPTDSRHRPDQRLMEIGQWNEANKKKSEVEDKQRVARKKREVEVESAMSRGKVYPEYKPSWFEKTQDQYTGTVIHIFKKDYWDCKANGDWSRCPDIF